MSDRKTVKKSISIVVPAYNEERFLPACLEAIAQQTIMPDEVIVVDNNSTDRSVEIAKSYKFVRIIKAEQQGIVYARNAGFDAARSDIIGRIDADTVLPTDWVERVQKFYAKSANQHNALAGGGYFYNVRFPWINGWVHGQMAFRLNRLIVGHYVLWGSNMAVPRQCWQLARDKVCMRLDVHEDFDLSFHLHDEGCKITYDESLRVGASLGRIFGNRQVVKRYMRRWPQTLKVHHFKLWWFGVVGNWLIWYIAQPLALSVERIARLLGRPPVKL